MQKQRKKMKINLEIPNIFNIFALLKGNNLMQKQRKKMKINLEIPNIFNIFAL